MEKRVFLFVLDGLGVGASEDANKFGDEGSNTLENVNAQIPLNIPTLKKLGLTSIDGLHFSKESDILGAYGKMREQSIGKDTTTGHFEMMGLVTKTPRPTFPNGFPDEVVEKLEQAFGTKILGNVVASGTQIIQDLGEEHLKTGYPIVYTSADSVLQIACHTDVVPLEKLYDYCKKAREIMNGKYAVGRVIARPFMGTINHFERINEGRRDYSVIPDKNNTMEHLIEAKKDVIAVGKISDIFAGKSISQNYPSHNNKDALNSTQEILNKHFEGLCFINLVDTDMLYGHRNNVPGYAKSLEDTDQFLSKFIPEMKPDDVLMLTGDHGNDPTTPLTDHSREFTPILIYGKNVNQNVNLGILNGFYNIGQLVEEYLLGKPTEIGEKVWKK
mgnify:FL=1